MAARRHRGLRGLVFRGACSGPLLSRKWGMGLSSRIDGQGLRSPNGACWPHAPTCLSPGRDSTGGRSTRSASRDRGERFYDACLEYAHSLWQRGYAARAILCLDRAMGADLSGGEPILADWPDAVRRHGVVHGAHPARGLHRQSPGPLPALRGPDERAAQGAAPLEGLGVLGPGEEGDARAARATRGTGWMSPRLAPCHGPFGQVTGIWRGGRDSNSRPTI
jgi:hypothetical protein